MCLVLILMELCAWAQTDTTFQYLNGVLKPCEQNNAYLYRMSWKDGIYYSVKDYYVITGYLKEVGMYSDSNLSTKSGMFEEYRVDKTLAAKGVYAEGKKIGIWKRYHKSGAIADSSYYKNDIRCKYRFAWDKEGFLIDSSTLDLHGNGYSYGFYPNGAKKNFGKIQKGEKQDSVWTYWHPNGQIRVLARFDQDSILEVSCFDSLGKPKDKKCIAEKNAEFPGGDVARIQFLSKNLRYPVQAKEYGIEGRVLVRFVVNEDGSISDIEALQTPGGGLGTEAIRIVKVMPKWKPGIYMDEIVKVYFTLPIMFSLH